MEKYVNQYHVKPTNNLVFSTLDDDETSKSLVVFVEPVAKQRPRFANGHAYTPTKTAEYEELLRLAWKATHKNCLTKYVTLECRFFMPIPKSWNQKNKNLAKNGKLLPDKKPDIDNLLKAVMDAGNECMWWDDRQVIKIKAEKFYGEQPRVEIILTELEDERTDSD